MQTWEERKKRYSHWFGTDMDESLIKEFEATPEGRDLMLKTSGLTSNEYGTYRQMFEPMFQSFRLNKAKNMASQKTLEAERATYLSALTDRPGREATILTPKTPGDVQSTILGGKSQRTILGG